MGGAALSRPFIVHVARLPRRARLGRPLPRRTFTLLDRHAQLRRPTADEHWRRRGRRDGRVEAARLGKAARSTSSVSGFVDPRTPASSNISLSASHSLSVCDSGSSGPASLALLVLLFTCTRSSLSRSLLARQRSCSSVKRTRRKITTAGHELGQSREREHYVKERRERERAGEEGWGQRGRGSRCEARRREGA